MDIQQKTINTIRALSVDMIQKANSGHPGAPMGMAAMAYAVWADAMCHNPKDPQWRNRDRFVLSNGHASALLYSLLHLFGYDHMDPESEEEMKALQDRTMEALGIGR